MDGQQRDGALTARPGAAMRTTRHARAFAVLLGALLAAAIAPPALAQTPASTPTAGATDLAEPRAPTRTVAWVARVVFPTVARRRPEGASRVVARVPAHASWAGGPQQLLVRQATEDRRGRLWLRVDLPIRPNGRSGWIRADYAALRQTAWRVVVSVSRRRVTVKRAGRVVRSFRAVVGTGGTPTPTGRFALSEVVRQPDPHGFLGPWALLLTAYSNQLRSFDGGPGRISIHGRDGASLLTPLGSAASHGCIRIDSNAISWMASILTLGTPVDIRR